MHALTILRRCVAPLLAGIHRRRLAVLPEAVAAAVSGPRLTLTEIGRRFGVGPNLRHRIKRADRLLGNLHLQRDGVKVPLCREVERLGWRWAGRVRGRDYIKLKHRWRSCRNIFKEATTTPTALGIGEHERLRPASRKRRACSRLFPVRLLLTLENCRTSVAELVDAIGPPDQWVANGHDALLAE